MAMIAMVTRCSSENAAHLSKESIPIPSPVSNQVLVKVSHVAQNPTDGKYRNFVCTIYMPEPLYLTGRSSMP